MKTIFLSVYDGDTEKNILRTGVLDRLKKAGHTIVLLIRGADRMEYYRSEFGGDGVHVELLPHATTTAERIWYFVGWSSLPTHSVSIRRHMYRAKGWAMSHYLLSVVLGLLGKFRVWRECIRFMYRIIPDTYAAELFSKYKPDLLFAPGMFSPEDCRLLKQAKRRGVRTIATAKSWDVLTTKAFTRVKADMLLVFNEFNREEAIALGDYSPERVVVTGFPQFDVYTNEAAFTDRDTFFRSIGADPNKRLIMIALPGDWLTPHSKETLDMIDRRIEENAFVQPLQVLARLHPKYHDTSESGVYMHILMERPGQHFSEKNEFTIDSGVTNAFAWTFNDTDVRHLANSLRHSDICVNTVSTLTLDAAANDTPVILIGYDGNADLPYWDQIARVYEREHYAHVVETGAAPLVSSYEEFEVEINRFLADPEYRRAERDVLKSTMLYKADGKSAERVADAILNSLQESIR